MVVNGADCDVPQKNNPELTDTHYIIHTAYVKTFLTPFFCSAHDFVSFYLFYSCLPHPVHMMSSMISVNVYFVCQEYNSLTYFQGKWGSCGDSFYIREICSFSQSFSQIICCFVPSAAHNNAIDIIRTHTHKRIHRP